jgi:chemotaxis protein histidine kinase CheA
MPTWTPTDLTNPEFVKQKLSPLDRSNALLTMNRNLSSVETKLSENKTKLSQIEEQTNGQYSFGTVRDARRAANEAKAAGSPDAAALQARFEELKAKRDDLTSQADRLVNNITTGEEALKTSKQAINNLEAAGAVPPGTNQFAAPPGYTEKLDPPAQVPDNQNPNPTPADTTNQSVENPIPKSNNTFAAQNQTGTSNAATQKQVTEETPGATQAEADFINAEAQRQVDNELGATQAEADFINAEAQKQIETELGATQAEANFINAEAQKQVSDEEISGLNLQAAAIESELQAQAAAEANAELTREGRRGLLGELQNTREQAITQDTLNYNQLPDWRVRISLAQGASYLYKVQNPGILKPLQATNGVVFPYTPSIQMGYVSNYDAFELVHSNYKIFQYKNSAVEQLSITADFTAQDATEAAYVLAVIHFFRTVTKMFYGKDQNPKPGTPPPLCYINGMGDFQFNQHPLVISNFSYTLPNDVDYIRAGAPTLPAGQSSSGYSTPNNSTNTSTSRMQSNNVPAGGQNAAPNWTTQTNIEPTYIPTKIQVSITALPIVTRKDISDNFSVRDYATGALMRGRQNSRGGIW